MNLFILNNLLSGRPHQWLHVWILILLLLNTVLVHSPSSTIYLCSHPGCLQHHCPSCHNISSSRASSFCHWTCSGSTSLVRPQQHWFPITSNHSCVTRACKPASQPACLPARPPAVANNSSPTSSIISSSYRTISERAAVFKTKAVNMRRGKDRTLATVISTTASLTDITGDNLARPDWYHPTNYHSHLQYHETPAIYSHHNCILANSSVYCGTSGAVGTVNTT